MQRCPHGCYWPDADPIALCCQICNPAGNKSTDETPVFNRRGAMTLTATGKLPKCPACRTSILTVSRGGVCKNCGGTFEIQAPTNLRANNSQPGICTACGSGIHFVLDAKIWECADCGEKYKAPKRTR